MCFLLLPFLLLLLLLLLTTCRFTEHEIEELKAFVNKGGSLVFFVGEGGDVAAGSNVNSVVEEYGMTVMGDAVVRTVYYKYLYPKEVFVANGVLQPSIATTKNQGSSAKPKRGGASVKDGAAASASGGAVGVEAANGGLNFVYPYGATLTVARPATVRSKREG